MGLCVDRTDRSLMCCRSLRHAEGYLAHQCESRADCGLQRCLRFAHSHILDVHRKPPRSTSSPVTDLPIEEAAFFAVTNLLLLSAYLAFDTTVFHLRLGAASSQAPLGAVHLPFAWTTVVSLWKSFVSPDSLFPRADLRLDTSREEAQDVEAALRVLQKASKSFAAAATLLPWDLRRDLSCLYALCRAADDVIDEAVPAGPPKGESGEDGLPNKQQDKLDFLHSVIDAVFDPSEMKTDQQVRQNVLKAVSSCRVGGADALAPEQKAEVRACASACISLRKILPLALFKELLRGYEMDLALQGPQRVSSRLGGAPRISTQDQLVEYCQCVAGVIGEMVVRVVLSRTGHGHRIPSNLTVSRDVNFQSASSDKTKRGGEMEELLWNARNMGVALQLINIARDAVSDAQTLKRCYLVFPEVQDAWIPLALSRGKIRCAEPDEARECV